MGQDKARIIVNSAPMLDHVVAAAAGTGCRVAVVGQLSDSNYPDVESLPDIIPGIGPLGGLYTALMFTNPASDVLLCPCDTPGLRTSHLEWLIKQWQRVKTTDSNIPALALIPTWDSRDQPLFAAYAAETLPVIQNLIAHEQYGMYHLLAEDNVTRIPLPAALKDAVSDVDTPGDLDRYPSPADH